MQCKHHLTYYINPLYHILQSKHLLWLFVHTYPYICNANAFRYTFFIIVFSITCQHFYCHAKLLSPTPLWRKKVVYSTLSKHTTHRSLQPASCASSVEVSGLWWAASTSNRPRSWPRPIDRQVKLDRTRSFIFSRNSWLVELSLLAWSAIFNLVSADVL